MTAQIVPVYYAPGIDNAWSVAPGALADMNAFAPLQVGCYGSMGTASMFAVTGSNILSGRLFRQIDGSVRLLIFRATDIDEYDNAGTRTNRGTGYTSTARWSAAAWGNQIIAVSHENASQSSTGAGFSALGGSSPKARYVAANLNFVMMADVDDGGSNVYSDMVWWSGLRNPATWTPAIATQAGNIRLLDAPGPITQLVAFRDGFVAFKDNSIFFGQYVGPPPNGFIFDWRLVSNRVGCIAPQSVCELDGKLYFLHSSGFWEFDGQNLRNIGIPVHAQFLADAGYTNSGGINRQGTPEGITLVQSVADDIEGIVWWRTGYIANGILGTHPAICSLMGYNPRTGKWGRHVVQSVADATLYARLVFGSSSDLQSFKSSTLARFMHIWNDAGGSTLRTVNYPSQTTDSTAAYYTTGMYGSVDGSLTISRHYYRTLVRTDDDSSILAITNGYTSENGNKTNGSVTGTVNTENDYVDLGINSKFRKTTVTWSVGKITYLAGAGFDVPGSRR